ncbi:immunity 52 family protein [Myxococcus sp. CA040A]|uniref:immunity 52 family protein n=1 Tax=Myxococcus sp. CA040A TaxID=2741738 RepID=UPI00157B86B9|nr:immunity 52 family protein [Myxococcus sp. CA040A]
MTVKPAPERYPESHFAGAYWGPRREAPDECARRAADFINLLAPCDPSLAHWYKTAKSPKDARKYPLTPPDVNTLTEVFRGGVNREKGGPVFEDLGYRVWFHNGGLPHEGADMRIKCGDYCGATPNSCFMSLPRRGPDAERVLTASVLGHVLRSMAVAWEPDWAVAMSRTHRDMDDENEGGVAAVWLGWVTYFARHWGTVPPLPAPVRIEPVEDKGMLIFLTPEPFSVANPEHVALARRVRGLLAKAGLMRSVIAP